MMPRWSDGGNLGDAEQVRREFGSGLVEPWGFWVIPEELLRRTLDREVWGLGPTTRVRTSSPAQRQREKGLSKLHTVCCSLSLGRMPVSSELACLSWLRGFWRLRRGGGGPLSSFGFWQVEQL